MRIFPADRKRLTRRFRNRIAPAIWSTMTKTPIVILVTISLWISQEALSQDSKNKGEVKKVLHSPSTEAENPDSGSFSKEDVLKPAPNPAPSLEEDLANRMVSLINGVGKKSSTELSRIRESTQEPSDRDFLLKNSFFSEPKEKESETPENLKKNLGSSTSNVMIEDAAARVELIQRFKRGLDFKLDFSKVWESGAPQKPRTKSVKYGLVLKEIVPEDNPRNYKAALNSSPEEELKYAGEADVVWTIGPISEEDSRRPFSSSYQGDAGTESDLPAEIQSDSATSTVSSSGIGLPKPSFGGNIKPLSLSSGQTQKSSNGIPGFLLTFKQEQGLYELAMRTDSSFKKDNLEHQVNMPIAGTLSLGRRYNDKMEVIRTSANNILVSQDAPSVSLHYIDPEKRYVTESAYQTENGYRLSFSTSSKTQKQVENPKKKGKSQKSTEQYQFGLSKEF